MCVYIQHYVIKCSIFLFVAINCMLHSGLSLSLSLKATLGLLLGFYSTIYHHTCTPFRLKMKWTLVALTANNLYTCQCERLNY